MESQIISLLPLIVVQAIYAVFAAQIAKRTNRSVPLFVILTIIPVLGAFFFVYVMWSTVLFVLDALNELKIHAVVSGDVANSKKSMHRLGDTVDGGAQGG